jgi:hypothetical protein
MIMYSSILEKYLRQPAKRETVLWKCCATSSIGAQG